MKLEERVARSIADAQLSRQYVDLDHLAGKKDGSPNLLGVAIEVEKIWHTFLPEARRAIEEVKSQFYENWDRMRQSRGAV